MPVRLARKEAPQPAPRPALRRVARAAAEPEAIGPIEAAPESIDLEGELEDLADSSAPEPSAAPRSILGRMVDAVRGRSPQPAAPAPPAEAAPGPASAPPSGSGSAVAPTLAPRAAGGGLQRQATAAPQPPARSAGPAPTAPPGTSPAALPSARSRGPGARVTRSLARTGGATAAAPALEPLPSSRPALTLVPTPPAEDPGQAPRSIARSGVDELAGAGGGEVSYGDDGMATIDFTGRGTPDIPAFSTTPVTVSRFLGGIADNAIGSARGMADNAVDSARGAADNAVGSARGAADNAVGQARGAADNAMDSARGVAGNAIESAQGLAGQALDAAGNALGGKQDPDEMYEQVLQRLRRDLVAELEQNGHLLRDHP